MFHETHHRTEMSKWQERTCNVPAATNLLGTRKCASKGLSESESYALKMVQRKAIDFFHFSSSGRTSEWEMDCSGLWSAREYPKFNQQKEKTFTTHTQTCVQLAFGVAVLMLNAKDINQVFNAIPPFYLIFRNINVYLEHIQISWQTSICMNWGLLSKLQDTR